MRDTRDLDLVRRAQNGDDEAVSRLLRLHKGLVRHRARALFLQGGDGDDLIQEGMIGLYDAICRFDPDRGASFSTFAGLCVRRAMLDAVRTASRKRHDPLNTSLSLDMSANDDDTDETPLGDLLEDEAPSPAQRLISREQLEGFLAFMQNNLTDLERTVAKGLLEGKTYADIARELDRSAKSVDNAVQRLRRKIRAHSEEEEAT